MEGGGGKRKKEAIFFIFRNSPELLRFMNGRSIRVANKKQQRRFVTRMESLSETENRMALLSFIIIK